MECLIWACGRLVDESECGDLWRKVKKEEEETSVADKDARGGGPTLVGLLAMRGDGVLKGSPGHSSVPASW